MIKPSTININDETDMHTVVLIRVRFKQQRWTEKWESVEVSLAI